MYEIYLGNILFPVAPEKIIYKTRSRNTVVEMINMEEISRLKTGGLTEYSFDVLLPGTRVPYAKYEASFKEPYEYIEQMEEMMKECSPVLFRMVRKGMPKGRKVSSVKKTVTVEGFSVTEAADDGFDVVLGVVLREYGAAQSTKRDMQSSFESAEDMRDSRKSAESYVVKEGDNLWKICRQMLNDGSKAYEVARLNGISNPDLIYPGQVIRLE